MHLVICLWGEKPNIRLREMIRNAREINRVTVSVGELMQSSTDTNDLVNFCDVTNWNFAFHVIDEVTAKWC